MCEKGRGVACDRNFWSLVTAGTVTVSLFVAGAIFGHGLWPQFLIACDRRNCYSVTFSGRRNICPLAPVSLLRG